MRYIYFGEDGIFESDEIVCGIPCLDKACRSPYTIYGIYSTNDLNTWDSLRGNERPKEMLIYASLLGLPT